MSDTKVPTAVVRLSSQAFLILCRMFDGFYDDLKKQHGMDALTESIAQSLLGGVTYLQEQANPPKELAIEFTYQEIFFLQKLVREVLTRMPDTDDQQKTRGWLEHCIAAFEWATAS